VSNGLTNEITTARTRYTKSYPGDSPQNKRTVYHRRPVHYSENGTWNEFDLSWQQDGGDWINNGGPWQIRFTPDSYLLTYTDEDGEVFTVQLKEAGGVAPQRPSAPSVIDQRLVFSDIGSGLDLQLRLSEYGVSVVRLLKNPVAPKTFLWEVEGNRASKKTVMRLESLGVDNLGNASRADYDMHRRLETSTVESGNTQIGNKEKWDLLETWSGRVAKTNADRTKEWTTEVEYPVLLDPIFGPQVVANANQDGFESNYTAWGFNTVAIRVGTAYARNGGIRWDSVTFTQGATINTARLTVEVLSAWGDTSPALTVWGDDVDDAASFATNNQPTDITKTTASAAKAGIAASTAMTIGITGIIQEIANRTGWAANQAVRFLLEPNRGEIRIAQSLTWTPPTGNLPKLYIDWSSATGTGLAIPVAFHHYDKNIRSG